MAETPCPHRETYRLLVRLRSIANLLNGSTALGLLLARAGRARLRRGPHGLLVGHGYRLPFPAAAAFTVGDVVLHREGAGWLAARPALAAHEARHAGQYAWCQGTPMLALYAAAAGWSWWRHRDWWSANPFERRAGLAAGGYPPPRRRRT